jgi:hypothetical protein
MIGEATTVCVGALAAAGSVVVVIVVVVVETGCTGAGEVFAGAAGVV